jgi:hypothetical protein
MPQHPSKENAVEARLYERRAEEMTALGALEGQAERFLNDLAHLVKKGVGSSTREPPEPQGGHTMLG